MILYSGHFSSSKTPTKRSDMLAERLSNIIIGPNDFFPRQIHPQSPRVSRLSLSDIDPDIEIQNLPFGIISDLLEGKFSRLGGERYSRHNEQLGQDAQHSFCGQVGDALLALFHSLSFELSL